jgi:ATP-binding cassette, subfamily B, bacterial
VAKETKAKTIPTILHFIRPKMASYLLGLIVFSFAEVSFYVSIPYVEKLMIDAAIQKDPSGLWRGVLFILSVSGIGAVSFVIFMYLFCVCVYRITATVRTRNFLHALGLPALYFEKHHSGDTVSRLTNDVNTLRNSYDWPIFNILVTLSGGVGAVVVMTLLDWRVSALLLPTSIAFTLLNMKFSGAIKKVSGEIQKSLGTLTEAMGNVMAGFAVIKQFRLQKTMRDQFEAHNSEILKKTKTRAAKTAWLESYDSLIGWINFSGVLAIGAVLAGKRLITFGTMVALVNYLWNVNRMIRETGRGIAQYQGYMAGAERVRELERESEEPVEAPPEHFRKSDEPGVAIQMRGVSFSYDGKRQALSGFDLVAEEGRTVGLVGPSGGGKSTVCKLLLGFYEPQEGSIALSGAPAGLLSYRGIRQAMAYVPQDPFMFDGTVTENIRYGNSDAEMKEVERAARGANAHEFITGLEKGYDTIVGERGVKLSGGQRQRLAIARAFLKDAPILLLDEATSSLDSQSERCIQAALKELGGRKTVIVIAHRLSTVEDADMIYVVDKGRVAEKGKHAELLARGGMYKKLHEIQYKLEAEGEGTASH